MTKTIANLDPKLAREAFGWDPNTISYGSGVEVPWRCDAGHVFISSPNARTSRGSIVSCPECSGRFLIPGVNDLQTTHPTIAQEAFGWNASGFSAGSGEKKSWMCAKGHVFEAKVAHRANGSNCPFCTNRKVLAGFNDLATTQLPTAAGSHESGVAPRDTSLLQPQISGQVVLTELFAPMSITINY